MRIERMTFDGDALVELVVGDELFAAAHVPLDEIGREERAWIERLARAAVGGESTAVERLLRVVAGTLRVR